MCLIILTLAKCTSPKVLAKMTFGRQSSDRNSLILENVLLDSLILQDNLKPMVSTKDYMVHLFNYQKIWSKNNNSLDSKKFIYTYSYL